MTIWSVGCDVGWSHFSSTSTFKIKDMELSLRQDWCNVCIVLWMWRTGWPFFKRWMWCCVKPIFPTSTFKVKEKHEPSVPTLFRCDVEALGCFWRQKMKGTGLNGGNALGNQYDQIGDSTKHQLWSTQWTNLERAQPHAIEGPARSLTHMYLFSGDTPSCN
jgi:hypothetical protein